MSLNSYDYNEQTQLIPRKFNVTISDKDKVISIEENGSLVATLSLLLEGEILKLIGKDNAEISSVELPQAQSLDNAYYDKENQEIVLVINMGQGESNELRIDVKELVDVYQEGNGITIDDEKKIHIKISKLSEGILNADENGLGIDLSSYSTEEELKEEARLREKYDDQLREDLKEEARLREEEDDAQWEAINKVVDDSAAISAEVARATQAEANLQTNINAETESRKLDVANLQTNINAETESRKIDVANLQTNINAETESRKLDVTNLQNNINAVDAKIDSLEFATPEKVDELSAKIDKEITDREEAVNKVTTDLNTEIENRTSNDTILDNKISEESTARSEEDAKLLDTINAVSSTTTESIAQEAQTRETEDTKLSDKITRVETSINEALTTKVPFTKVMKDGVEYNVIILDNHANLLGYNAEKTSTYNLAMVSKWNVADFGSIELPINLNGSNARPTYNDDKEIALVEDITNATNTISLVKKSDLEYALVIGEKECGVISIPQDQFLKSVEYNNETHILSFVFNTSDGEATSNIDMSELVDVYTAGNGILIDSNAFSIKLDTNTQKYIEVSSEGLKIVGIDEALSKKVDWTDISTDLEQGRKAIVLKNHDTLLGTDTSGNTYNIAMVNKWDIVDLGTNKLPINLNTPSGVRPTVQEAGQSGEEANQIAYVSDIEKVETEVSEMKESTQGELDKKVDWTDISTESNPNRKSIVLKNHDTILGTDTSGNTRNIAMINKWDIVDLGTTELPINLNTPKGVRPTVQESGQSGEEANKVAYVSDIETLTGNDSSTSSEISIYGTRKYVDEQVSTVDSGIDSKFEEIKSNFDNYVTKEQEVSDINQCLSEAKGYTDTRIGDEKLEIVTEAVNNAKTYTDEKIATVTETVVDNSNRISSIEGRCDHYDDLFTMIVDEHGDPVTLNFYTKTEVDTKLDTKAEKTDIQKGVYNLGEINSYNNLGALASAKGVCDNQDNVILSFKITTSNYGKESGFIINVMNGNKISQALYWKQSLKPEMYRELTIDENGDIANTDFLPYEVEVTRLYNDTLPSQAIFSLTTSATNEEVQAALTDVLNGGTLLTQEQLDSCLKYGYYLLESSMRNPVYVGWNGNSYTLTMFGLPNPKGDLIEATVAVSIVDGVYSITRNGSRHTILTSSNISNDTTVKALSATDEILLSRIEALEERLSELSKTNVAEVVLTGQTIEPMDDKTKDYVISGNATSNLTVTGKSAKLDSVSISNQAVTIINANDIEFKNVNLSGDFPKTNGNAAVKLNNAEYVVFKNMVFDSSNIYNGIEIGLSEGTTLPKSILFDNCKFLGNFSNNGILIFGTQDNAVININNCYFESVSNPIRLSNKTNVHCTLNITNCQIDKWDVTSPWQGLVIMQDYTSKDAETANTNNLYAPDKITINVINTIGPNNKKITMPNDISTICGVGTDKQVFYVWDEYRNLVAYDKTKYPTINII